MRLLLHRLGQEADEVAGVAGFHGHAYFAIRLEAADAWSVSGARIDDDERPGLRVDLHVFGRIDADEHVIDRPFEGAAIGDHFERIIENVRCKLGAMVAVLITALPQRVPKQDLPLDEIGCVLDSGAE